MALTVAQFMRDRQEFASAGAQLVKSAMDEATRELDATAWGNVYDTALSLLTAHKLWSSPFGASMRLDGGSESDSSRYSMQLATLQVKRIPRIMVL
jgi:hypothetical protein